MKNTNLDQNFIIELNYKYLHQYIGGLLKCNQEECNDEKILAAFKRYKDLDTALYLLGLILDNIKYSLIIYICRCKDKEPIKAEYDYENHEVIELKTEDASELYFEFNKIRNQCMVEAQKQVKYYKEYFTRLYDRSRTIK